MRDRLPDAPVRNDGLAQVRYATLRESHGILHVVMGWEGIQLFVCVSTRLSFLEFPDALGPSDQELKAEVRLFPAFRTIEDDPGLQTITEINETVFHASRNEQKVTSLKGDCLITHHKPTSPPNHDVTFIPAMRSLKVFVFRYIQFDLQFSSQQTDVKSFPTGSGNAFFHLARFQQRCIGFVAHVMFLSSQVNPSARPISSKWIGP